MPSFPIFPLPLLLLLLLSRASVPLASTSTTTTNIATHNRRTLHQPFLPEGSNPPTQPPAPPPPTPVSISSPNQPPFFPSLPSPPSPPSLSSSNSFPANISSLVLPQPPKSKPVSSKLVGIAIALVVSAVLVSTIIIFLYVRKRRRRSFSDSKSYGPDSSNGLVYANPGSANGLPRPTRSPPRSSEFLYLGTVVDSHCGVDANVAPTRGSGGRVVGGDMDLRKLESPELQPLPPLGQRSFRQNYANVDVGSGGEEEDEEFYSPRGSSAGGESSIAAGSASRRSFAALAAENYDVRSNESSSSPYSSSNSHSPARSASISISPPVSLSPRITRPKSPELVAVQTAPPPPPPPPLTPWPVITQSGYVNSSPSPSPPSSSSPERASEESLDSSSRTSNVSIQNTKSPLSITGVVPNQLAYETNYQSPSPSSSITVDKTQYSSPEKSKVTNEIAESPARTSSASLNQVASKKNSRSSSLSSLPSPERPLEKTQNSSLILSNVSNSNAESPARTIDTVQSSGEPTVATPTPPPPPPLPPPPPPPRHRGCPASSPSIPQPILKPPVLGTPSRQVAVCRANAESPARASQTDQSSGVVIVAPPPPPLLPPTPPPPPPPPPPRHWECPVSSPSIPQPILKTPVLVTPSRSVAVSRPTLIPPIELSPTTENTEKNEETSKPKLKPLHWDKVRASSDREMVWDQLKSSSFKLNEEMIETLFTVNTPNSNSKEPIRHSVLPSPIQENMVLDPKKAQNIAISLRALNVTIEEVCDALSEGNSDALGTDLLESLLKMAPTKEEERRLREYKDDSPFKLGPAERFLKAVLDVPYAFKRLDAMLYIANFESEVEYLNKSFETLEVACDELRNSRMFLKLLEAVLKTGNRMNVGTNRGDAHAFKLDTLLKLVDVKGADGKTTLLHFVVQEIIRSEGARVCGGNQNAKSTFNDDVRCRKLGLQVVSGLSSELTNVKKAASIDSDVLISDLKKLSKGIGNIAEVVRLNEAMGSNKNGWKFSESMKRFMKTGEEEIIRIQAHESVALSLVKEITEYFHGNSAKEEAHPFRIFTVVRDFLSILDRVCKEIGTINERTIVSSAHKFPVPVNPTLQPVNNGFQGSQHHSFSVDES